MLCMEGKQLAMLTWSGPSKGEERKSSKRPPGGEGRGCQAVYICTFYLRTAVSSHPLVEYFSYLSLLRRG